MDTSFAVVCLISQVSLVMSATPTRAPTVNTTFGPVSGIVSVLPTNKTVKRYLGIPFAKAERLEYPVPPEKWTSTLNVNITGKICPQPSQKQDLITEDCLQLNVYIPDASSGNRLLPVLLWIHGGGYIYGDTRFYDGSVLATEGDVIVVTAAYRLGALGFLSTNSDDLKGNYGMMDQIEAMKWVNKNIERFGGDPEKVTIFGESAGGMSVALLMLSPLTSGLYQNVIMQSGTAVSVYSLLERNEADERARSFAKAIGCEMVSLKVCVKTKSLEQILQAQLQVFQQLNLAAFGPVVDGYFLTESPSKLLNKGRFNKSNVIIGITRDDGSVFTQSVAGLLDIVNVSQGMNYTMFQSAIKARLWIRGQTEDISRMIIYEYNDWSHVGDLHITRQRYMDVATDSVFKAPAVFTAEALVKKQSPTYYYQLEQAPKVFVGNVVPNWLGIFHGADILYTFGFPLLSPRNMTSSADIDLSKHIMSLWTNFAKTGNPNKPSNVTANWPQYTSDKKEFIGLSQNLTVRAKMRPDKMAFWNEFLPEYLGNVKPSATSQTPTIPSDDRKDNGKDIVVMVLAILAGIFGALTVILLVVILSNYRKVKRQGKFLSQSVNLTSQTPGEY